MNKIILASASPRRRELLLQIGMEFEVIPSKTEEKTGSLIPWEMVLELSERKAMDIYDSLPAEKRMESLVVGADTVVSLGNKILGKPGSYQDALDMLTLLQGRTHQVYTGVTVIYLKEGDEGPSRISFYEKTDVTMYPMSGEEITAYVNTGEPMDKAGAYGIQGKCAAYIKEIKGDYYNVVGLPIGRLYQEIKRL
ncbi:MAG: Maf family protein [Lachnospiraceae bacterium]|nr:Maf family protein [Lachnospiraceae bacterium]